jgi:hypothetical protein
MIYDAADRLGVRLPDELEALLELSDGLSIPGAGVTLRSIANLQPVEGAATPQGRPGAIWFGEDTAGNRYAVTVSDWREPDGGRVVRVASGEAPAGAPIIGSLPAVVTAWLEGETV